MPRKQSRKSIFRQEYVDLMNFLKTARVEQGMSQSILGKKIGRDHTYVSKYENCIRRLDVFETIDICEVLGVTQKQLIKKLF